MIFQISIIFAKAFSYLFHICISVIPRHMLICAMLFVLVIDGPLFVYAVIKPTLHTYILPTSFLSFLCLNEGLSAVSRHI